MRDDTVRMIAEDVLLRGWKLLLSVQTSRKVGRIQFPDRQGAQERAAAFQIPRCCGSGEQRNINKIWDQKRPKYRDCTSEKEASQENGDGQSVAEHNECLEAPLKADVQWRPVDSVLSVKGTTGSDRSGLPSSSTVGVGFGGRCTTPSFSVHIAVWFCTASR